MISVVNDQILRHVE